MRCLMDYIEKHKRQVLAIEPRVEPLDTPVDIVKEERTGHWGNYIDTQIIERTELTGDIVSYNVPYNERI